VDGAVNKPVSPADLKQTFKREEREREYFCFGRLPYSLLWLGAFTATSLAQQSLTKPLERESGEEGKQQKVPLYIRAKLGGKRFTRQHKREPTYPVTKKHGPR